jgi:hypothetical protein
VFVLSGAEDLVPVLEETPTGWKRPDPLRRMMNGVEYTVRRYRPRIEALFARIERWTEHTNAAHTFWRSISKDNITTWYGKTEESRVADPHDAARIFQWLICETHDDKGNVIAYGYKKENSDSVDVTRAHERNRNDKTRSANRYLKRVRYGNRTPFFQNHEPDLPASALPADSDWMFEVVLDYGEHSSGAPTPGDPGKWKCRHDPFSIYRAGFEIRTYRLCQRFLMFHHFKDETGVGDDCLARSLDLRYRSTRGIPADAQLGHPVASFVESVTSAGYRRDGVGGYVRRALPALEFTYSEPVVSDRVQTIDLASLENLPAGLGSTTYQ